MKETSISSALVFTRTKYAAKKLAVVLEKAGHRAVALQGNMTQNKRKQAMDGFRQGRFNILVATDIAARGIDVSGISHVINYDVPATVEAYTHRTGRTGRADHTGEAFTFVTSEDTRIIRMIEKTLDGRMIRHNNGVVAEASTGNRPGQDNDAKRAGRPARSSAKRQSAGSPRGQKRSAGRNSQQDGGGRQEQRTGGRQEHKAGRRQEQRTDGRQEQQKGGRSQAPKARRRRRSAPLGVDFFTNPRRTGAKNGRNAA